MKRYEQLADEIADLIGSGTLRAGDRLPSVRQTSVSRRLSPSTVFEAYYLLEARGLVRARPRSGYYVNAKPVANAPQQPLASAPPDRSVEVAISDLVFEVLGSVRDRDVVPLGSAFPSPTLFPLQRLARDLSSAMRELDPWRTVEGLGPGHETLRRQLGLRYAAEGMALDAQEIVVTNGAMEALTLSLSAVTQPGDLVAVESPTFYAALQALERLQLKAVEIATHPRSGVDLDALASALDRHPIKACWFMPNFQNPLGSLMPEASKQALVALLAARGVPLIEDDVYGELHFDARRPPPAKAFDRAGLVMHCSSFSKCLAPGYRIGWVAGGRFAQRIERMKLMTTLAAPIPSQEALSRYLQRGGYERHLRSLRQSLAAQRDVALRLVAKHFPQGTRVTQPQGGYFLWLELPPEVDALKLHRLALSQRISIAPGPLFSADHERFRHCVRINFGHPGDARFEAAMRTVGRLAGNLVRG